MQSITNKMRKKCKNLKISNEYNEILAWANHHQTQRPSASITTVVRSHKTSDITLTMQHNFNQVPIMWSGTRVDLGSDLTCNAETMCAVSDLLDESSVTFVSQLIYVYLFSMMVSADCSVLCDVRGRVNSLFTYFKLQFN